MVLNKVEKEILLAFLNAEWGSEEMHDAIGEIIELVAAQKGVDFENEVYD